MKPITIKDGAVSVKAYFTPSHGYESWTVQWREPTGDLKRKTIAQRADAELFARTTAARLKSGLPESIPLTYAECQSYVHAMDRLEPFGVSLPVAVDDLVAAYELLPERTTLLTAVREYVRRNGPVHARKPLPALISEFIATKPEGRWQEYLEQMLRRFGKDFDRPLFNLSGDAIQTWLDGLKVGNRSKRNHLAAIRALAAWARKKKYLPADWEELDAVSAPAAQPGRIAVYSPEETAKILAFASRARPHFVPYLAVRAFAGTRDAETRRLTWDAVHRESGWIAMDAGITKVGQRRLVPLLDNLRAWLDPFALLGGPLCSVVSVNRRMTELVKEAGVEPRHNAFRDSFISYRLALTQNVNQVADEAGNSPTMIGRSYREVKMPNGRLITPDEAKVYFSIRPTG